ncbi:hypothetical protein L6452_25522 [Arctium lappa]|uniref:Uncharacterized protein n=1 Tax=Arctium lappa TaxID=4217 RepID=A0ACB9AC59_ARCLA|nr:hypothetical protein L6452_25522 [Arctium lappa]
MSLPEPSLANFSITFNLSIWQALSPESAFAIKKKKSNRKIMSVVVVVGVNNERSETVVEHEYNKPLYSLQAGACNSHEDLPLSSYDFVYLPTDFKNKCNVGYGFVNMTSPEATWRLYKAFHYQSWEVLNSKKICEVSYARVQGVDALKEHFKNSRFPCEVKEYMPVVFEPPRDGLRLTEPTLIVGQSMLEGGSYSSRCSNNDIIVDDVISDNCNNGGGDDDR